MTFDESFVTEYQREKKKEEEKTCTLLIEKSQLFVSCCEIETQNGYCRLKCVIVKFAVDFYHRDYILFFLGRGRDRIIFSQKMLIA